MDYLALFLESRVSLGCSANTLGWYRFHLDRFASWLEREGVIVLVLTPLQFQSFIAHQRSSGYSPSTVSQSYSATHTLYRWLVDMEELSIDPTRKQKRPKIPDYLPTAVAREYLVHLLDGIRPLTWVDHRDRCILELLFCTGLRAGEVRRLFVSDIDMGRRSLHVKGKGAKGRLVFYPEDFKVRLWQWIHVHRPETQHQELFLSSYQSLRVRGPLSMGTIYNMLSSRVERAATDWKSPHAYRHGFAVDMLRNGASTRLIQQLLGHSDIKTTERYLRLVPELVQGMFDGVWNAHPLLPG